MRFFHYRAVDASGRPAEGTIRAASAEAAHAALVSAGYRVATIAADPGPSPTAATPSPAAATRPSSRPAHNPPAPRATGPVVAAVPTPVASALTASPKSGAVKTPFGKDRDLYFIFSQLAQYFRSGVTPHMGLNDLSNRTRARYQASLRDAAGAIAEGKPMSGVFERYPYLYPPDVVGALRAGEISGHLGEACDRIADQLFVSHRLKRRLSYFLFVFLALVGGFPLVYGVVTGSLKSIQQQDQANGSLPVNSTLARAIGSDLLRILPAALLLGAVVIGLLLLWNSMPARDLRHRLVLVFPILGGRAKAEAMARFTWALGLISRGGASPQTTFRLAAESVPNLVLRQRLMDAASGMHESERLSAALKRSQALPVEYTHIVETGEVTGDVPRALSDIGRAIDADFQGRDSTATTRVSFVFYALLGILTLFMLVFLYKTYFGGIITTLTSE